MDRLVRALSKMFLVLVLLFGSPPVVTLRDRARRPVVALVMPLRGGGESWPPALPGAESPAPRWPGPGADGATPAPGWVYPGAGAVSAERVYIPVRAA